MNSVPGYTRSTFTHQGVTHPVHRRGSGPGVIVIHEIPGITPTVAAFADRVVDAGFTVLMPELFGTTLKPKTTGYAVREIARACINHEFRVMASRASSPITVWLRALARELHGELGGPGVGALGMCLTGNFALAMAVDEVLMAPVLSQPSLPFPVGATRCAALHLSDADLATVKHRCARQDLKVLGLRFTHDRTVPGARFQTLRQELGEAFEGIEIDSSPTNPHGLPRNAHSVLTEHLIDEEGHPTKEALDRVLGFFRERLVGP